MYKVRYFLTTFLKDKSIIKRVDIEIKLVLGEHSNLTLVLLSIKVIGSNTLCCVGSPIFSGLML